jgi:hypothetical protein
MWVLGSSAWDSSFPGGTDLASFQEERNEGEPGAGSAVANYVQQQFFARNSNIDSCSNAVWYQLFVGENGAPATSFGTGVGQCTDVSTTPVSEEEPLRMDAEPDDRRSWGLLDGGQPGYTGRRHELPVGVGGAHGRGPAGPRPFRHPGPGWVPPVQAPRPSDPEPAPPELRR